MMTGYGALYLHVPFCRSKCAYCDFDSRVPSSCSASEELDAYFSHLHAALRRHGEAGELSDVRTVYLGGGTPTFAGDRILETASLVRRYCTPNEFTCEANPDTFSCEMASALAERGVTRVSLGVQTLEPSELRAIGRIHTADQALDAIEAAHQAGFSVSCDLMCGLPGQTAASWRSTLSRIIDAAPHHVSVYPLQLEEGTALYRSVEEGRVSIPDEDFQATCMTEAERLLSCAGYERYEVASYALPGHACRHNIAYWTGVGYLGLGRSAASMHDTATGRIRRVQTDDAGSIFETEELTAREAAAEDLMLACRMTRGISPELLDSAARSIPAPALKAACERAVELGLASWHGGSLAPTRLGWLDGNALFGLFWDLAQGD
ncbi:MAG: radical SAM family heme chaperone HemW [Collinsella sp.]|nr:radical SAM family heme chaperone HemW [Collinsella sp.]